MKHMFGKLALVTLIGLSTACVSVLPEPDVSDALYRIEGQRSVKALPFNITIREPEAPRLVAGQAMVSEGNDGGLRLVPGVEWSGPASRQMQLAIIDSFDPAAEGAALLPEMGVLTDYELATHISTLRLIRDEAVCEMTVTLLRSTTRKPIEIEQVSARKMALDGSASDVAAAMQSAASDCAAATAGFAAKTLSELEIDAR